MAISLETIRKITIQGSAPGVDEATAKLVKLAEAQGKLAVVSDQDAKRVISSADAYRRQTLAMDEQARVQAGVARATKVADSALAQGLITQEEHAKRLQLINSHYGQVNRSQQALSHITQDFNGRVAAATGSLGTMGQVLSALGPIGIGVAAGFGAAALSLKAMLDRSKELAEKAQELRMFADATGLTTQQVQALRSEAGKFGLTADEVQNALQQFTARFNQLRLGEGELLTQVRRLNPELALQMQAATDAGEAMTLFGQALQQTSNIFERNALVRAATGRGGLNTAQFLSSVDVAKLTTAFTAAGKGLDDNFIRKIAQLNIDIEKTAAGARRNFASIFAEDVLETQLRAEQSWLRLSEIVKNFSMSDDLRKLVGTPSTTGKLPGAFEPFGWLKTLIDLLPFIRNLQTGGVSALPQIGSGGTGAGSGTGAVVGASGEVRLSGRTPEAELSNLKARIAAMGEAATYSMRLAAAQKELAIAGRQAGLSETEMAKALSVINQSSALQALQARIGLLGDLARADEVELAVTMRINLERAKGINFSDEEIRRMKERARLQHEYSQLPNQIGFERSQMFRTDIDAAVAGRLRGANLPIDFNSATAQAIRFNEQLRLSIDLTTEFASGFVRDLRQGVSVLQALTNALNRFVDRLLDMAIKGIVQQAFGGLFGGLSPFGGGGVGDQGPTLAMLKNANGNVFERGNVYPFALGGILDRPTVFPFANGIGLAGEAGTEAIMPLKRGPGGELGVRAMGTAGSVIRQEIVYRIEGAVTEPVIAQMIHRGMRKATQDAVSIASAAAPARQAQYERLGT